MSKPVSIKMRGSRWLISLDAQTFAALYGLCLLGDSPFLKSRRDGSSRQELTRAVIAEAERIRRCAHPPSS